MKYRMVISYDGTPYVGWQIQPQGESIQGILERTLERILQKPIRVIGAGRTDAGVHALGQVAHFVSEEVHDCKTLQFRLNCLLPKEIRIMLLEHAEPDFHAMHSARSKIYHYHLWLEPIEDPFLLRYRHKVHSSLELTAMHEAAQALIGTHDFTTFANCGSNAKEGQRTLQRIDFVPQAGGMRLEFEGNGFLYKMVRNLVGMLLEVGRGKRSTAEIPRLLAATNRTLAPPPAPALGLFLVEVKY